MRYKYAFYIHHHGSGHVMRAVSIARSLPAQEVAFFGSNLDAYRDLIPNEINYTTLPPDTPTGPFRAPHERELSFFHYAPLNVPGIARRNQVLTTFFAENPTCILIVDVSVEITLLARLCSIPTVVIRQHGRRMDTAHRLAYESAELIIAPYPESLSAADEEGHFAYKTFFSGGFSRFDDARYGAASPAHGQPEQEPSSITVPGNIGIFMGRGGSCFNQSYIKHLREVLPKRFTIHVLGELSDFEVLAGVVYHGDTPKAKDVLRGCEVVICDAGHNCVMELGSLRKPMICMPAPRPFDEQEVKADLLAREGLALVVKEKDRFDVDWERMIENAKDLSTTAWGDIMNPRATEEIADRLKAVYSKWFERCLNDDN